MGLCFSLAAVVSCSSGGAEEPAEIKEAVAGTDYSITYYWGPPAEDFTEETVLQMKEAGFDTIPLQRFPWDRDALKEAVGLLEKHGLYAAVSDGRIADLYAASSAPSQRQIDQVVERVVEDYKEYGNIREWIICDEPGAAKFTVLARIVDAFRRIDPDRKTFINLLPLYAPEEMLGTASYEHIWRATCARTWLPRDLPTRLKCRLPMQSAYLPPYRYLSTPRVRASCPTAKLQT